MELFCSIGLLWSCFVLYVCYGAVFYLGLLLKLFCSLGLLWSCILFRFVMELYFVLQVCYGAV